MDTTERRDVLDIRHSAGLSLFDHTRLLEEEKDALPELLGRESDEAHEEEDSVQNRQRDELENVERKARSKNQTMSKESREACLLKTCRCTILGLIGHGTDVQDARYRRCNEPRQTQKRVDADHDCRNACIVVIGVSVRDLVRGMVNNMPSDTVVQESQNEGKGGRSGSNEDGGHATIA